MKRSLEVEDGVLGMYAGTDAKNKNQWYFYEIYASDEDYLRHRLTQHSQNYIKKTSTMTVAKESIPVKPILLKNKGGL